MTPSSRSSGCSTAPTELSFRALGMRFVAPIAIQCVYASLIPIGAAARNLYQNFSSHTVILASVRRLQLLAPTRVTRYHPSTHTVYHSNAKRRSAPLGEQAREKAWRQHGGEEADNGNDKRPKRGVRGERTSRHGKWKHTQWAEEVKAHVYYVFLYLNGQNLVGIEKLPVLL